MAFPKKNIDPVAAVEENIAFEKAETETRWAWQRACVKHMTDVLKRENLLNCAEEVSGDFYVTFCFQEKQVVLEMNTHDPRDLDPDTLWAKVYVNRHARVDAEGSVAKCVDRVKVLLGEQKQDGCCCDPVAAVEADIALEKTRNQGAWDETRARIKHVTKLLEQQDLLRHVTSVEGVSISFRYSQVVLRVPGQRRACVLTDDQTRVDTDGDLSMCVDRVKALLSKVQSRFNE